MASKKPKVTLRCPAAASDRPDERRVEITFPDGRGCLVRLCGAGRIEVYRADPGISVSLAGAEGQLAGPVQTVERCIVCGRDKAGCPHSDYTHDECLEALEEL